MEEKGNKEIEQVATQEPTLFEFVESIFEGQGKMLSNGDFSIKTVYDNPKFFIIHLIEDKDNQNVAVYINKTLVGYFTKYTQQGYKYKFQQEYRKGIRIKRTPEEQYMEDTCIFYKDTVLLNKAYH